MTYEDSTEWSLPSDIFNFVNLSLVDLHVSCVVISALVQNGKEHNCKVL